jgi:antitoxin (DNA-binding transcriptional repressor) of toxin-antitoxin stability system
MNLSEAEKNFTSLVNRVYSEGISVDLERDHCVIARLTPVRPHSPMSIADLNTFLRNLPKLGDDANVFADEVRKVRSQFPVEKNPWD